MTNDERNPNDEIRNRPSCVESDRLYIMSPKFYLARVILSIGTLMEVIRHLNFVILSSFAIRHSSFLSPW